MNYLITQTFAVNHCAYYTFKPKKSNKEAMKRIGRYLKGTVNKGIILKSRCE